MPDTPQDEHFDGPSFGAPCVRRSCMIRVGVLLLALAPFPGMANEHGKHARGVLNMLNALANSQAALVENFEFPTTANYTVVRAGQSWTTANNVWRVESGTVDLVNTRVRTETVAYGRQYHHR